MADKAQRSTGMTAFTIIWIGQILSLLGTAVGQFGLRLWVFDASGGQATPMTLIGFFFFVPMVAFTPLVGVLVDRANRKLMMMLSDLAAALTTLFVLILFATGNLQVWHLYITAFVTGTFQGFQWPAYSAAITTMLDKKHYTRANAMLETAGNASGVFAPLIAGALIGPLGLYMTRTFASLSQTASGDTGLLALLALDLLSASFAIGALLFVHIPQPEQSSSGREAQGSFWHQAAYGLRYILARPSLLGLQLVFLAGNFCSSLGFSIWDPMILARTNSNAITFGSVQTAGAVGGIVGGVVVGAWGGFKRRVHGVLIGWALSGIGIVAMGLSKSLVPWLVSAVGVMLFTPLVNGSNQAIWQAKVPPDIQGRVFATRRLIAWLVSPVAQLAAGPLADRVMEPWFTSGTPGTVLTALFGQGPGAGMGAQLALAGLLSVVVGLSGYLFSNVRNAETLLPDHDSPSASPDMVAQTA